jgi:hypothetical protein
MLALAMLLGMALVSMAVEAPASREYQIKAAFLVRFAEFVEWPSASFAASDSPIRIGILGNDPFGEVLENTIRGERIRDRPVVVVRSQDLAILQECHLAFISASEEHRLAEITMGLSAAPLLTVSDIDGFAEHGGIIRFYLVNKKVRFEINPSVAQQKGLRMSAQLLALGKIIGPPAPKQGP